MLQLNKVTDRKLFICCYLSGLTQGGKVTERKLVNCLLLLYLPEYERKWREKVFEVLNN